MSRLSKKVLRKDLKWLKNNCKYFEYAYTENRTFCEAIILFLKTIAIMTRTGLQDNYLRYKIPVSTRKYTRQLKKEKAN